MDLLYSLLYYMDLVYYMFIILYGLIAYIYYIYIIILYGILDSVHGKETTANGSSSLIKGSRL